MTWVKWNSLRSRTHGKPTFNFGVWHWCNPNGLPTCGLGPAVLPRDAERRVEIPDHALSCRRCMHAYQRQYEHRFLMERVMREQAAKDSAVPMCFERNRWGELYRDYEIIMARWKVFAALRAEGLSGVDIGRLCGVPHTSVYNGLRKLDAGIEPLQGTGHNERSRVGWFKKLNQETAA
jgi:hypothetical protein